LAQVKLDALQQQELREPSTQWQSDSQSIMCALQRHACGTLLESTHDDDAAVRHAEAAH
jgi:hypothetical protein